jgi:hypothetical protein
VNIEPVDKVHGNGAGVVVESTRTSGTPVRKVGGSAKNEAKMDHNGEHDGLFNTMPVVPLGEPRDH